MTKTPSGKGLARELGVILLLAAAEPIPAWVGKEHEAIGYEAYREACRTVDTSRDTVVMDRYFCGDPEIRARIYGSCTRLSGDHVSSPGHLFGRELVEGLKEAQNDFYLARLALENSTHFHPMVIPAWEIPHAKALRLAMAAYASADPLERKSLLDSAFFFNSFGDHFIQDAYSTGHMGINRRSSSPTISKFYHDKYCESGVTVVFPGGRIHGYGDKNLSKAPAYRALVVANCARSIRSLQHAARTGAVDPDLEAEIASNLPSAIEDGKGGAEPVQSLPMPRYLRVAYELMGHSWFRNIGTGKQRFEGNYVAATVGLPNNPPYAKLSWHWQTNHSLRTIWQDGEWETDNTILGAGAGYQVNVYPFPLSVRAEYEYMREVGSGKSSLGNDLHSLAVHLDFEFLSGMVRFTQGAAMENPWRVAKTRLSTYEHRMGFSVTYLIPWLATL